MYDVKALEKVRKNERKKNSTKQAFHLLAQGSRRPQQTKRTKKRKAKKKFFFSRITRTHTCTLRRNIWCLWILNVLPTTTTISRGVGSTCSDLSVNLLLNSETITWRVFILFIFFYFGIGEASFIPLLFFCTLSKQIEGLLQSSKARKKEWEW